MGIWDVTPARNPFDPGFVPSDAAGIADPGGNGQGWAVDPPGNRPLLPGSLPAAQAGKREFFPAEVFGFEAPGWGQPRLCCARGGVLGESKLYWGKSCVLHPKRREELAARLSPCTSGSGTALLPPGSLLARRRGSGSLSGCFQGILFGLPGREGESEPPVPTRGDPRGCPAPAPPARPQLGPLRPPRAESGSSSLPCSRENQRRETQRRRAREISAGKRDRLVLGPGFPGINRVFPCGARVHPGK